MARILIVEDSPTVAMREAYQLWNAGHEVQTATTGAEALAMLSTPPPDLIVLDYELPDMNGLALLDTLRSLNVHSPAVMVTSHRDERLVVAAMKHGVVDYLVKSSGEFESLATVVQNALNEVLVRGRLAEQDAELKRSEETARVLLDATGAAAMLVNADGTVLSINAAGEHLLGLSTGQRVGEAVPGFCATAGDPLARVPMRTVLESGLPEQFELHHEGRHLEVALWPVFDPDRQVARVAMFYRDITERWKAERDLRLSHETLERKIESNTSALVEANARLQRKVSELARAKIQLARSEANLVRAQRMAHLGNWELDLKSQALTCSGEALRLLGLGKGADEIPWATFVERVHPGDRAYLQETLERAVHDHAAFSMDHRIVFDGSEHYVHTQGMVDQSPAGKPLRVVGTVLDITRRKIVERELQHSRGLLQTVFESYPHWIWVVDCDGRFLMVNRKLHEDFGVQPHALVGKACADTNLLPQDFRTLCQAQEAEVLAQDGPLSTEEFQVTMNDGGVRSYAMARVPLRDEHGEIIAIVGIAEDITARIQAEEERRLLATAVNQAAESIIVADHTGAVQYVNPAFERITGYSRADVLGQPAQFLAHDPDAEARQADIRQTLSQGESWQGRLACVRKDATEYWVESTISPMFDAAGALTAYVAVNRDVTRQQKLEADLRQSQKLEAIGTMVSGIAHEINNILTPVMGYAELLLKRLEAETQPHGYALKINKSVMRARDLIRSLLSVSRKQRSDAHLVSLNSLVTEVMGLINVTVPKHIRIQQNLCDEEAQVAGDAAQLQSVLMNLCINASHAMPDGGELSVQLDRVDLRDGHTARPDAPDGPYARVTVRDTGIGMDDATRQRIFEPFFTTKEVGQGTGLGLYIVYGIVQEYGGFIDLQSAPQNGTTFQVYLPLVQARAVTDIQLLAPPDPRGTGLVLLVDDEDEIRQYCTHLLVSWGYGVESYPSGEEGLARFRAAPQAFDLVLTDFMCPPLFGDEMLAQIRELRPEIPAILTTGYAESAKLALLGGLTALQVLRKPWTQDDLARSLCAAFQSAATVSAQPTPAPSASLQIGVQAAGKGALDRHASGDD